MSALGTALFEIGSLDQLAMQDTFLHRLDPRAKLITTLGFILIVVSFDRYAVAPLLPLLFYPLTLFVFGNLPFRYLARKILLVSPFAVLIGIFNPFLDTTPLVFLTTPFGQYTLSGGWVSFLSILIRFVLTVSVALMLVATTGFTTLCAALDRLGVPRMFVVQLLFLYRYIFVLTEEGLRMTRARRLRSFDRRGMGPRVFGYMLGQLLLRTVDRARNIHRAMLCRGFDGEIRIVRTLTLHRADVVYTLGWLAFFGLARMVNLPLLLGELFLRVAL